MPPALLYHDVVAPGREDDSGFTSPLAARYKLTIGAFRAHLDAIAIAAAVSSPPVLTFDDGGVSAIDPIAVELERHGWTGLFFVTTDYIGTPGFLDGDQIRQLRRRGHVIGSHSCSHPKRISHCPPEELFRQWRDSRAILSDVLREPVTVASVPGGFYSRRVAEAAAQAGLRRLYTSEPTDRPSTVDDCTVLGRYAILRTTPARTAAALAAGKTLPRLRQVALWNVKKAAKAAAGPAYFRLQARLLGHHGVRDGR